MKPHTKGKTWFCNDESGGGGRCLALCKSYHCYKWWQISKAWWKDYFLLIMTIQFWHFFQNILYFCMCIFSLVAIVDHICASFTKKKKRNKQNLAYMCNCKMHYIPLFSHNCNVIAFGTRGVSHYGLAIYINNNHNAKEELLKLKYFLMQKYNLQKIL
jgi:hypothetical protein